MLTLFVFTNEKWSQLYQRNRSAMMAGFCYRSSCLNLCPHYQAGVRSKGWGLRDGCLCVCDNDGTIEIFISGSSLFIPKLTFASVPQSTWTTMTTFESLRKDRDLSPLLREGSWNPSINVSILVSTKMGFIEQLKKRGQEEVTYISSYWISQDKTKQFQYGTDIFGRRNRSKNKSILKAH